MNTPVQGGAAECMLSALIRLQKQLSTESDIKLVLSVHDELLLELPVKLAEKGKQLLVDCMTKGFTDVFPNGITNQIAEAKSGPNWAKAKE